MPISENCYNFNACKFKRCQTCPSANILQTDQNNRYIIFCKSYNVMYKLTCNKYSFSYVGLSSNAINQRINQHKSDVKNFKDNINTNLEFSHYFKHGFENMCVDILNIIKNIRDRINYKNAFMEKQQYSISL